jgi:hypothetical protein
MSHVKPADEFVALREEISNTQRRDFQVICAGAFIIPAISYLNREDARIIVLGLPLVVVSVVLMHIGNTHAIIRIGRYIREQLEGSDTPCGWETWLQRDEPRRDAEVSGRALSLPELRNASTGTAGADRRTAEQYMKRAVSLLFGVYYIATTSLALSYTTRWGVAGVVIAFAFYALTLLWLCRHLFVHLPVSTSAEEAELRLLERAALPITENVAPPTGRYVVGQSPGPPSD